MTDNRKTNRRSEKMRGVVLIMVVTVMTMLIILLLATLTVVSTAQNRYYTKYEENQAYYAARSALDVFSQSILQDAHYIAQNSLGARTYKYMKDDGSGYDTAPIKQGLAMEFELYKLKAGNDAGIASNFVEDDKVLGDSTVIYEDVLYGTDLTNDENIYQLTFPSMKDGTENYGIFVDTDSSGVQKAKIIVKVLERHYNMGGSNAAVFAEMEDSDLLAVSNATTPATAYAYPAGSANKYQKKDLAEAIRKGDRLKDRMRVEITAEVEYNQIKSTAVLVYDTTEKPVVNSSNAITAVGGAVGEDSITPIGGISTMESDFNAKNNTTFVGDSYIEGNLTFESSCHMYFFKNTVHTVRGNFTANNDVAMHMIDPGAVLYVTGTFNHVNCNSGYGTSSKKMNIIADTFKCDSGASQPCKVYGNIYCNNLDVSKTGCTFDGGIYTNKLLLNSSDVALNDEMSTITFNSKDYYDKLNVAGNVVVRGATDEEYTIDAIASTATRVSDSKVFNITGGIPFGVDSSKEIKATYDNPDHYGNNLTTSKGKEFTLPVNLAGLSTNVFEAATAQKVYGEIFKVDSFINDATDAGANGDVNTRPGESVVEYPQPSVTPDYTQTAGYSIVHNEWYTETVTIGTMTNPDNGPLFANGTITDANKEDYYPSTSGNPYHYSNPNYDNDKKVALYIYNQAVKDAKENDEDYKNALDAYYQHYVSGAEKAGASAADLLEYKTTGGGPITMKPIASAPAGLPTDTGATTYIDTSGYIKSGENHGSKTNPVIIDARTNEIVIQLGAENGTGTNQENVGANGTKEFYGVFVVVGDKPVKFYLPDGRTTYNLGDATTHDQHCFYVATYEIFKQTGALGSNVSSGTLSLGSVGSSLTKAPNIYFYAGNDVEKIDLRGYSNFIAGYIYAPFATFAYQTGEGYKFGTTKYNNETLTMNSGYCIVGSVICKDYKTGNNVGVAYINPNVSNYTPGDPMFSWKPYMYRRS